MKRDGVFVLPPAGLSWAGNMAAIAEGIERLHAAGWPPSFIWLYDEAWIMLSQIAPLLRQVCGMDTCFDLFAYRVAPGEPWMPPRRLRPYTIERRELFQSTLRDDGRPMHATCWIPVTEASQTSSCLMCIPRSLDAGYAKAGNTAPLLGLQELDKVRPLAMPIGGACVLSHRLYHWGKIGDAVDADGERARPQLALSIAIADKVLELPRLSRHVLPLPPLQLRVALVAAQTLVCARSGLAADMRDLMWCCFLAHRDHFSASFQQTVLEASASSA